MTKQTARRVEDAKRHLACGNRDSAAAILSALIRSALRDRTELVRIAETLGLTTSPRFIV
jgi:hypothetical protein